MEQKSSPWIASAGWTVCHSFKTTSHCCDKVCVYAGVCVCLRAYVCQLDGKRVRLFACACLMWALRCRAGCPATIFDGEQIKKSDRRVCPNILAANKPAWTHISVRFGQMFPWRQARKNRHQNLQALESVNAISRRINSAPPLRTISRVLSGISI